MEATGTGAVALGKTIADMYSGGLYSMGEHIATEGLDKGLEHIGKDYVPADEIETAFDSNKTAGENYKLGRRQ